MTDAAAGPTAPYRCRFAGVDTTARITVDGLTIPGPADDGVTFPWLDADEVTLADHRIRLAGPGREPLALTHLGVRFDEFADAVREARGRARRAALAQATTEPSARFEARSGDAVADVYLFPHVLTVEPRDGRSLSVPLPLLRSVARDGHRLTLDCRVLEPVRLGGLGRRTDEFCQAVERARHDLAEVTAGAYEQLAPGLGALGAPDGWAVGPDDAGSTWPTLVAATVGAPDGETGSDDPAAAVAARAGSALRIGVFTEGGRFPAPFLLAPVGDRLVVETVATDESRATLVFGTADADRLNAALLLVAFRREVLTLPADELGRWAVAARTQPLVQWARDRLAARIVHGPRWADQLAAALT